MNLPIDSSSRCEFIRTRRNVDALLATSLAELVGPTKPDDLRRCEFIRTRRDVDASLATSLAE